MIKQETIPPLYTAKNVQVWLNIDNPHTYFGMPRSVDGSMEIVSQLNECEYREEICYMNYSPKQVTISNRNGLSVIVPSKASISTRDVIIRKIITFNNYSIRSAIAAINHNSSLDDLEVVEIRKSLMALSNPDVRKASIMIDYKISPDEIKAQGNTIYHYQTDMLISYEDMLDCPPHPHSHRFLNVGAFGHTHLYPDQPEFNFKIRYVCFDKNAQPLYMNVLGKIHVVHPQKSAPVKTVRARAPDGTLKETTFENYIQVFYNAKSDPDIVNPDGVQTARYTIEDAKIKLGLYNTYSEAKNSKSSDSDRREELLRLSHDLELLRHQNAMDKLSAQQESDAAKHENDRMRAALEQRTIELKTDQSRLDAELQKLNNEKTLIDLKKRQIDERLAAESKVFEEQMRQMRQEHEAAMAREAQLHKDARETAAQNRKDITDFVKIIPALLIGIGAIATLAIKLSAPKES